MPPAHIYSDNILVASTQNIGSSRNLYTFMYIGCIIHLQRQQACKDKGVLRRSLSISCRSSTTRISRGSARALAGRSQHRHASLHSHAALCTSAVTLTRRSCSRSRRPSSKISGLFSSEYCSGAMCRSRGAPAGCS